MKPAAAALALMVLGGCLSAPIPQELVDVSPFSAPEPLLTQEIVRLSKAGLSDEVLIGLIRSRGVADRPRVEGIVALGQQGVSGPVQLILLAVPSTAPARTPEPRIVYREFFIPLWPSYSRGRWHFGLRVGCYTRTLDGTLEAILPQEPESSTPLPDLIDP